MAIRYLHTSENGQLLILVPREKRCAKKCTSKSTDITKCHNVQQCIRYSYDDLGFFIGQNPKEKGKENEISYSFLDLATSMSICTFIESIRKVYGIQQFQILIVEFNSNKFKVASKAYDGAPRAYSVVINIDSDEVYNDILFISIVYK